MLLFPMKCVYKDSQVDFFFFPSFFFPWGKKKMKGIHENMYHVFGPFKVEVDIWFPFLTLMAVGGAASPLSGIGLLTSIRPLPCDITQTCLINIGVLFVALTGHECPSGSTHASHPPRTRL